MLVKVGETTFSAKLEYFQKIPRIKSIIDYENITEDSDDTAIEINYDIKLEYFREVLRSVIKNVAIKTSDVDFIRAMNYLGYSNYIVKIQCNIKLQFNELVIEGDFEFRGHSNLIKEIYETGLVNYMTIIKKIQDDDDDYGITYEVNGLKYCIKQGFEVEGNICEFVKKHPIDENELYSFIISKDEVEKINQSLSEHFIEIC